MPPPCPCQTIVVTGTLASAVGTYFPLGHAYAAGRGVYQQAGAGRFLFYWGERWCIGDRVSPAAFEETLAHSTVGSDAPCPTQTAGWVLASIANTAEACAAANQTSVVEVSCPSPPLLHTSIKVSIHNVAIKSLCQFRLAAERALHIRHMYRTITW